MKVAVIGAAGFIGQRVVAQLSDCPQVSQISTLDRIAGPGLNKVTAYQGDFSDPVLRAAALEGADAVICLASVLGGAAEVNYALARRVNVDATLDLIEYLRDTAPGKRFVFASTVAAYGQPFPPKITDQTPPNPQMVYGAQKVMLEVALSNFAARGWLDAVSLRPAGIVARDGVDAALKSAFLSRVFHAVRHGEDITLPVTGDSTTWLSSVENVARNFVQAVLLPDLGEQRAFTLPTLRVSFDQLVQALLRHFPDSGSQISFAPDPECIRLFGQYPSIETEIADGLGFSRDEDVDALVASAF